jgi:hypothetical protein
MTARRRPAALSALGLAASLVALTVSACGYGDGSGRDHHYYSDEPISCSDVIEQSTIDTDELLDVDAGDGAGAFIEYEAGGVYHVTTSCDSDNGGECYWDIIVRPLKGPVVSAAPLDLEDDDQLRFGADDTVQLVAATARDFDGFSVEVEPGIGLEVDVVLDGACGNRYLFWVGDGALHSGAPSNPIDLIPSAP